MTTQPKLEGWAQEFDEKFRNGATNTVRNLAIKSFIRSTLASAIKEKVEEVREEIERLNTNYRSEAQACVLDFRDTILSLPSLNPEK